MSSQKDDPDTDCLLQDQYSIVYLASRGRSLSADRRMDDIESISHLGIVSLSSARAARVADSSERALSGQRVARPVHHRPYSAAAAAFH
eukprot:2512623-Pleurochrysis_carterae.AAC.1